MTSDNLGLAPAYLRAVADEGYHAVQPVGGTTATESR
jgi:hypothetical protein